MVTFTGGDHPDGEYRVIGGERFTEQYPTLHIAFEEAKKVITDRRDWLKAKEILEATGYKTTYNQVESEGENLRTIWSKSEETKITDTERKVVISTTVRLPKSQEGLPTSKAPTAAFNFQSTLLHALSDGGWEIRGIKTNRTQEVIATLAAVIGQEHAQHLADQLARSLAGRPYADID